MLVCKRFEKRALTFTGMLFVGKAEQWWVWTVVGRERKPISAPFTGYPLSKVRRELQWLMTLMPVTAEVAQVTASSG
jgi:hypothetical protein